MKTSMLVDIEHGRGQLISERRAMMVTAVRESRQAARHASHETEANFDAYIQAAGIADARREPLLRAAVGKTKELDP